MFHVERGVLLLHEPPRGRGLLFLCWPVWVYRVTAPVVRVRRLDIFEKVILALCRAGLREPGEVARRIHQDVDLCAYVMRQLRAGGQLDASGAPTSAGRRATTSDAVVGAPELVVTHVFQDPATGELWPRVSTELRVQPVARVRRDEVDLRLAGAGHPRRETAYVIAQPPTRPVPPRVEQVVDAIRAHRLARAEQTAARSAESAEPSPEAYRADQELQAMHTEWRLPEDVSRIADIRPPTAEYLLTWVELDGGSGEGPARRLVRDPFGLDPALMLEQLILGRLPADPRLAEDLSGLTRAADTRLHARYARLAGQVRRRAEAALVERLGEDIRRHPQMMELLLGVADGIARGEEAAAVETVVRDTVRAYEQLFRRVVDEYRPVVPGWLAAAGALTDTGTRARLRGYAADVGLTDLTDLFGDTQVIRRLNTVLRDARERPAALDREVSARVAKGSPKDIVPWALIAAADAAAPDRHRHPLRDLARRRPALLSELQTINSVRNGGAHSERSPSAPELVELCRNLALDAGRTVLLLTPEREGPPAHA
ncbi:hypothetical protein [Streptomyces sp. SID3343]|uniref:hypothetical protein n=1 Tax=Streptomyces sp. SID3343 TaxID=2690260 RepID=UPI00136E9531|nr:hypothetical protein [Streptomyces sp. SID3343]MYW03324.1 hypothetical protein [Streptomyces sp. SID3343]MYW04721.1 hypothetical protein [Streptomyces sp. SID3343]